MRLSTRTSWPAAALGAVALATAFLLIVTWDEDDYTENNQIPTIVVGQHVAAGQYDETINHYNVLATLEQMYGLAKVGSSASASVISDIWN